MIGAPFISELVIETAQTGSDGTRFTRERVLSWEMRDAQGRVRTEREVFPGFSDLRLITIWDLVGGYQYVLDSQHRVAHRQPMTVAASKPPQEIYELRKARWQPGPQGKLPSVTKEGLGVQMFEGVYTEGWKFTRTLPAGFGGSDRPFVVTEERWAAPEMALAFLIKTSDPRAGEQTVRRTKLTRTEPDAALFQPPADYTLVDEPGVFRVVFELPVREPAAPAAPGDAGPAR